MRRVLALAFALAFAAACGRAAGPTPDTPQPADDPHAGHAMPAATPGADTPMGGMGQGRGMGMGMGRGMGRGMGMGAGGMSPAGEPTDSILVEGKAAFDEVCAQCHTLAPPPNLAPPMRMVAMHLRKAFETEEDGVAHVLAYVASPDPDRSILPAHAIERFGLMAPQPIPGETLRKVARYVWWLGDGAGHTRAGLP